MKNFFALLFLSGIFFSQLPRENQPTTPWTFEHATLKQNTAFQKPLDSKQHLSRTFSLKRKIQADHTQKLNKDSHLRLALKFD